jgi:ribonuclease J
MATQLEGLSELKYDRVSVFPLGGQSEIGQVLWVISHAGEIMLVDAGACYPPTDLPGVDLLLPNTNFLAANQDRITALLLTNGHEEHCGAVAYLLNRVKIPRILAPRFVSSLVSQNLMNYPQLDTLIDTVNAREQYKIGPFSVEWIQVNDAIADACALRIATAEGVIVYTSSFKLDQTPVDGKLMDINKFSQFGDSGVTLLISDSAGVEARGYSSSEKTVTKGLARQLSAAEGRVFVAMNGTNTHRLQILFDLAKEHGRKVVLYGDALVQTALAAAVTGNLNYDRSIEASLDELPELAPRQVLVVATGSEGDALGIVSELAFHKRSDISLTKGDVFIFSADIFPGQLRRIAVIQDQLLSLGVHAFVSTRDGVHVAHHAGQEELKLMLTMTKPRYFVPAIGEGRHIMHHARLAEETGVAAENIFTIRNGTVLELFNGGVTAVGTVESEAVLFNRNQAESVTRFSVNERRSLSTEGVLNIACVVDSRWNLLQPPAMEGAALGFVRSDEWEGARYDLVRAIEEAILKQREQKNTEGSDINSLRAAVREVATKTIRSKLQSKPTIHVVVHEVEGVKVEDGRGVV